MLKPVLSISFAISGKVNHEPRTFRLTGLVLVFALLFSGGSGAVAPAPAIPQAKSAQDKAPLAQTLGQLPLIFIQNQGQMDSRVAYYLQGQDTTIYFAVRRPDLCPGRSNYEYHFLQPRHFLTFRNNSKKT